jgi:hypothetical protein
VQRFFSVTQDINGNAVPAVAVTVKLSGTGTFATLYSTNDILSPLTNPFTSNPDGTFQFYAANGRYDITLFKTGITFTPTETADLLGLDVAGTISPSPLVGTTNDYAPGGGAESAIWLVDNNFVTRFITGIAAPQASAGARTLTLVNANATFNTILSNNNGLSLAPNRIVTANARDYVIAPGESVDLRYFNTKWNVTAFQGVRVIDQAAVGATINNSGAETTIYTKTIAGGLLGTGSRLRVTLVGRYTNTTAGTTQATIRLKYGGTTYSTDTSQPVATNASTNSAVKLVGEVIATGATNTQEGNLLSMLHGTGGVSGLPGTLDRGTSAIDSTADQTLLLTWQWASADPLISFNRTAVVLEWLP